MGNITPEVWIVSSGVSYADIATAMAAASAGDTLLLSEGSQFTEDVTVGGNNMTIMGQDRNTSIISGYINVGGYDGVKIKNLTMLESGTGQCIYGDGCDRLFTANRREQLKKNYIFSLSCGALVCGTTAAIGSWVMNQVGYSFEDALAVYSVPVVLFPLVSWLFGYLESPGINSAIDNLKHAIEYTDEFLREHPASDYMD